MSIRFVMWVVGGTSGWSIFVEVFGTAIGVEITLFVLHWTFALVKPVVSNFWASRGVLLNTQITSLTHHPNRNWQLCQCLSGRRHAHEYLTMFRFKLYCFIFQACKPPEESTTNAASSSNPVSWLIFSHKGLLLNPEKTPTHSQFFNHHIYCINCKVL